MQVQRVAALCSRVAALIAHEHGCADAMIAVCTQLTPQQLNRLQSIFDSFDLELVSDFIRIRIFDTSNPFAQPSAHTSGTSSSHCALATKAPQVHGTRKQARPQPVNMHQAPERSGSRLARVRSSSPEHSRGTSVTERMRQAGGGSGGSVMRFEQLRAAGHPFVEIADRMLVVRSGCTAHAASDCSLALGALWRSMLCKRLAATSHSNACCVAACGT